ncbi:hypothetical protein JD969_01860 [Planctomycetota bacterium]|nr:hypothetical protein JD969_01860 [Planctomycetota bacterium]
MKMKSLLAGLVLVVCSCTTMPIEQQRAESIHNQYTIPVNVNAIKTIYDGRDAFKVTPTSNVPEKQFVKIPDVNFTNGTIELLVSGEPAADATTFARGFVGLAFRVTPDNAQYECFYIRPTNGRAEDQLRRNHSVQYISYPEYPWHKLRKETPGKYEAYADLVPGQWTKLKIEVNDDKAKLYVNDSMQPTMIVNDLKHGYSTGAIALWVGPGTVAHFSDLKITEAE